MRFICIGAHPDDCEIEFGGTAARLAAAGHAVKFLSCTSGDAGHHRHKGEELARIRALESREAARRLSIEATEALANHDGELLPTVGVRREIVRRIREWKADIVLTHRPNDYHPDHRYTSQIVQDAAYLVLVPNICPDAAPLDRNPVFFYLEDRFQKPTPFNPDVVVDITASVEQKVFAMDAHFSQFYEWLPWVDRNVPGSQPDSIPADDAGRRQWLARQWVKPPTAAVREALIRRYGPVAGAAVQFAEAFELCEYGSRPSPEELDQLFPR